MGELDTGVVNRAIAADKELHSLGRGIGDKSEFVVLEVLNEGVKGGARLVRGKEGFFGHGVQVI